MDRRLELHEILRVIPGVKAVYFQPPANIEMDYPCIVYKRDNVDTIFADNEPYSLTKRYMITSIDTNPDSEIPMAIAKLPMTTYSRSFTVENLNHDNFTTYF